MATAPGTPTQVTTKAAGRQLGQRLLDRQRTHPFVVIARDRAGRAAFDADEIAAALKFRADVWVVDDAASWALNEGLGSETVYGEAAGVFPPHREGRLCRLLFTPGQGHSEESIVDAAREVAPGRRGRGLAAARPAVRPSSTAPTTGLHIVETADQVDALAAHLLSPGRDRPVAVVTIPMQRTKPWIDADEIATAVGPEAEVHLIPTGPRTFQLTGHLSRLAGVYGGAGRVYDVGQEWLANPYLSPLRFAYDRGEGSRATEDLINDLMGALSRSGHLTTQTPAAARRVRGDVSGLVTPSRALLSLDDGSVATVWAELTAHGLNIDAILTRGMQVTGLLDADSRRVDIAGMVRPAKEVVADLATGVVVLARVLEVRPESVALEPYPGVRAEVAADLVTGNDHDDLTDLLSRGEVVVARYLFVDDDGGWCLSLHDVDDDEEPVPVSLIDGGPPWLRLPTAEHLDPHADAPPAAVVKEETEEQGRLRAALTAAEKRLAELQATSLRAGDLTRRVAELETQLRSRDLEVDTLQRELRDGQRVAARLQRQVEHERTGKRQAVQRSNKGAKAAPAKEVHGYSDPTEQMRWDLQRTWVEQTRPEDKARWALPDDYALGPDFCRSVDELEGVSRERVLLVAMWILVGRPVTDDHPLRSSKAGGAPAVTRVEDGVEWVCRRAPLQQSSASARRLSYWRSSSGQIELSRVTLHDDLTP